MRDLRKNIRVVCWDEPAPSKPVLTKPLTRSRWTLTLSANSSKLGQVRHDRKIFRYIISYS